MNNRTKELLQRAQQAKARSEATLKRTAPKATLGGIKQAAEKKFGQRKSNKKQNQPKKVQPKKQPKPKSVSSDALDQWKKAMEKANIPRHRWRKLEDKISRLSGVDRKKIEESLFEHKLFQAVYSIGEDEPELVDDYLSELEDKVNELSTENMSLNELIDNLIELNPDSAISAAILNNVVTKRELTTALATISSESGVASDEILKFGIYSTDDISAQGISAEPIIDFELSANAIQNRYGIDVRTPEGQDKFNDLVVFEALGAAAKQNVDIASDPKKLETLNKMGIDRLNEFERITGTNIIQYVDNNDDSKLG